MAAVRVCTLVAEAAAAVALAAASSAFVEAMTAWAVTSLTVASLVESPAPPFPLYIAIVTPTKTEKKEKGIPENPLVCCLSLSRLQLERYLLLDVVPEYRTDNQQCKEFPRTPACTESVNVQPVAQQEP